MKRMGVDIEKKRWSGNEVSGFHNIMRMAKRDQRGDL